MKGGQVWRGIDVIIVLFHLYQKACRDRTRSRVTDGWFSRLSTDSREHGKRPRGGVGVGVGGTCQRADSGVVRFHEEKEFQVSS